MLKKIHQTNSDSLVINLFKLEINSKIMIKLLEIAIYNSRNKLELLMSNNGNIYTKKMIYIRQNKKILQIILIMHSNQSKKTF